MRQLFSSMIKRALGLGTGMYRGCYEKDGRTRIDEALPFPSVRAARKGGRARAAADGSHAIRGVVVVRAEDET